MEAFFTFLLFTFVGLWLLGVIGRWLLRGWIARKQREFQQQFGGDPASEDNRRGGFRGFYSPFGNTSHQRKRGKEGEVTVTQNTRRSQYEVGKGVGEYVEFEEVEQTSTMRQE